MSCSEAAQVLGCMRRRREEEKKRRGEEEKERRRAAEKKRRKTAPRRAFKDAEADQATLEAAAKYLACRGAHEDLRQRVWHLEEGNATKC